MKRFIAILGLVTLAGCSMSEEKFAEKAAAAACASAEECDTLGDLTVESCEKALSAYYEALVTSDACDYDGGAAKKCVSEMKGASCDGGDSDGDSACVDVCGSADG